MFEKYFRCECHVHGLVVSNDKEEKLVFIEWIGCFNDYSFWERLKLAWKTLFNSSILYDDIIFNYDKAKGFAKEVLRNIND